MPVCCIGSNATVPTYYAFALLNGYFGFCGGVFSLLHSIQLLVLIDAHRYWISVDRLGVGTKPVVTLVLATASSVKRTSSIVEFTAS